DELKWAAKPLEEQRVGPPPKSPADVLRVQDLVLVSPAKEKEPAPAPARAKGRAPAPAAQPDPAPATAALPLFGLRQIPAVSGAIVALDPHTGRVLAMTGGFSYEMSQFNRAVQARR